MQTCTTKSLNKIPAYLYQGHNQVCEVMTFTFLSICIGLSLVRYPSIYVYSCMSQTDSINQTEPTNTWTVCSDFQHVTLTSGSFHFQSKSVIPALIVFDACLPFFNIVTCPHTHSGINSLYCFTRARQIQCLCTFTQHQSVKGMKCQLCTPPWLQVTSRTMLIKCTDYKAHSLIIIHKN